MDEAGPTASIGPLGSLAGSQGPWLQGPGVLGLMPVHWVCRAGSWTLCGTGPGSTLAVGSWGLKASGLLVGEAMSPPS